MNLEEFNVFFENELIKNNINIPKDTYKSFFEYMNGIIEWNEKINVTAITEPKMFIVKHFIDSLTVSRYLENKNKLLDIGTGAGFPGIPLKIANPSKKITLIDSVNKKLNVIRDVADKIKLKDIEIIHTRAEDLANRKEHRERYDVVVTRAVSNMPTILEYMLPFVKLNGIAICMKGPNIEEDINNCKEALRILGGKIEKIEKIKIDNELERNIIIIRKEQKTPNKYPRSGGKPLREPII